MFNKKRFLSIVLVLTLLVTSLSVLTGIIKFDIFANAEGENLIVNGDFENGMTGWTPEEGKSNGIIHQAEEGDGDNLTKTLASLNTWIVSDAITVKANTDYVLTFDARSRATSEDGTRTYLYIEADNSPGGADGVIFRDWDFINDAINSTWTQKTVKFNTGNNTKIHVMIDETNTGNWSFYDNFKLVEYDDGIDWVINNGFDTDALYDAWVGENGKLSSYDGGKTSYGGNPIDNSITWAWLADKNSTNGTRVTIEANTYYDFSADVYVPAGKTIGFAIHGGESYTGIDNDKLVWKFGVDSDYVNNGWATIQNTFNSGAYSGEFWLTVYNGGTYTGTDTSGWGADGRVRFDSVKIAKGDGSGMGGSGGEGGQGGTTPPPAGDDEGAEDPDNLIKNGNFKNGTDDWFIEAVGTSGSHEIVKDAEDTNKSNVLKSKFTWVINDVGVAVEQYKDYVLTFDYKTTAATADDTSFYVYVESDKATGGEGGIFREWQFADSAVGKGWQKGKVKFNSGNATEIFVGFCEATEAGVAAYVDNVCLKVDTSANEGEEKQGLIPNGNFAEGMKYWSPAKPENAAIGKLAGTTNETNALGSLNCWIHYTQPITVEPNTEYILAADIFSNATDSDGTQYYAYVETDMESGGEGGLARDWDWANDSVGQWATQKLSFTTGPNDTQVYLMFNETNTGRRSYIDNVRVVKADEFIDDGPKKELNFLENGSFEDGYTGWSVSGMNTGNFNDNEASNGSKSAEFKKGITKLWQYVRVEKNTQYAIRFDFKGKQDDNAETAGWFHARFTPANRPNTSSPDDANVQWGHGDGMEEYLDGEWHRDLTTVINSGDYEWICIYFVQCKQADKTDPVWIDNVRIESLGAGSSLIANGAFELGDLLWTVDKDGFEFVKDQGVDGTDALHVKPVYHKLMSQAVSTEVGKNYKISFKYKGTIDPNTAHWAVSAAESMSWHQAIARGKLTTAADWTEASAVFTAEKTKYFLMLHTAVGSDFYIDNIQIDPTSEAATVTKPTRAYDGGHATGSFWNTAYAIPLAGYDKVVNGDFVNAKSNSANDAANFFTTSNGGKAAGTIVSGDKKGASYFGNKSLKFEAGKEYESVSIPIKLEKNKTYYVGMYFKSEYFYAKNGEWTSWSYGLADAESDTYLNVADYGPDAANHNWKNHTDDIQNLAINDDHWHYVAVSYSTNDQTDFEFLLRGRYATVYIDRIYVWETAFGQDVPSLLKDKADCEVTDTEPTLLGIKEGGKNLIENFNFEDAVNTYWFSEDDMRSDLPGDTLFIKDSGDANQGEALVYQNYRKYPTNAYYFKWIDVEPNTEYTFSAKYAITEKGNGALGIVSGFNSADMDLCNDFDGTVLSENLIFPTILAMYKFNDDHYLDDHSWQYAAVSFNTKDRNRVGIVVLDDGGTAYMDDFRLFKTSDAAKLVEGESDFPTEFVSKKPDQINVSNGVVTGVKMGTKLSEIIESFQRSTFIKVFDENGKQVSDLNTIARSGLEIRLLNGPQIAARATIVIPGDVVADGILDSKDVEAIIKHITMETIFRDEFKLKCADVNGDGKIDIYDTNFNTAAAKTGTADFTITGPEKFAVGDEIEVQLNAGASGLRGINGLIKYNQSRLEFVSAALDMDGNWMLSTDAADGELTFAAVDASKNNGTEKDKPVITLTFKVGNVQKYSDVQVLLAECFSTTGNDLLTSAEYLWTPGKVPTTNDGASNDSNTGSKPSGTPGGPTTTTVQAANRLAEFRIEGVKLTPEFDPEIKDYTATVPYSVKEVKVIAVAADEGATVKIGDTKLEYVGKNVVAVQVTSADGLKRTYRVVITREAPEDDDAGTTTGANEGFPIWAIVLIAAGALLLLAAIIIIIIIIAKKRKRD
ncbi:MAG: hypothetical protein E7560_03600 [Ruminococcaceae bacterium]|nr:hypothetical protein [Oscillospiraceae bacterium]